MKSAISATLGTARPTFEVEMARNEPLPVWPSTSPSGSAIDERERHRDAAQLQVLPEQRQVVRCRRPAPPRWFSRALKMKSIASPNSPRAAKVVRHARRPRPRGQRLLDGEHEQVEHDREQHAQPAGDDARWSGTAMSAKIASPSPPAPARNTSAVSPTVVVTAIRSPAMISGSASGSSTRHSSWRGVRPMPRPASRASARHALEAGDHVAEDDQQRVGDERDHRRRLAAAGERQQQEEDARRSGSV